MEGIRKREFPHYYAPGRLLFHVIIKISDSPGSLGNVISLLSSRVNLVGVTTYTLEDGSAMVSAFTEALSRDETSESLRELVLSSRAVRDADVKEGKDGILVDTFHVGMETDKEDVMLIRRTALNSMFGRVHSILGTGGETLLYEEGVALGKSDGEGFVKLLGPEKVRERITYLRGNLAAQGWGKVKVAGGDGDGSSHITIEDCFECAHGGQTRTGCHFFRGYIVGNRLATLGQECVAVELKCSLKGDRFCEFVVRTKA